jgi:hypothetical protein
MNMNVTKLTSEEFPHDWGEPASLRLGKLWYHEVPKIMLEGAAGSGGAIVQFSAQRSNF